MNALRKAFLDACLSLIDPLQEEKPRVWYRWAGKDPATGLDCSGMVTWALWKVGGPDWRESHWSALLWDELPATDEPQPGDLALYGPLSPDGKPLINHVMVWTGDGCVIGASGGNRQTINEHVARIRNAFVKKRHTHRYRIPDDFRGFRILTPLDKEQTP